ncbi:MAG: hypothetical protein RBS19_05400 [Bacteroidales bacterium]|nr:hypothetical protein [Bacteroidales bacterium]MDY0216372.1 hypothetical protein [Bacteroidales bacterium]
MIDTFLKAKHWQLFVLTFGIPMAIQFAMVGFVIFNLATHSSIDSVFMFNYMRVFPLVVVLFMGIFFAWHWSVAIGLQKRVPENVTMKVKKFKVFFFIPLFYMSAFMIFFAVFPGLHMSHNVDSHVGLFIVFFFIVFFLHLFAMFCILYTLYFVAKTFKTVELHREVTFSDFAGEFFLIWFFPIGIWILQPKINKMIEN